MPGHLHNIECLNDVLMGLATYGGARVPAEWQDWLRSIGVAEQTDDTRWMSPTRAFLTDTIPAKNANDLVRRVAIRDPLYRLHLDLSLISVIHAVAVAQRWRRLEEILFDACREITPRLMQLLEWQMAFAERAAQDLTDTDWNRAHESVLKGRGVGFSKWDNQLWGESRGPVELFPLLLSLYIPLSHMPIHFIGGDAPGDYCLARLVKAAGDGEGVGFGRDRLAAVRNLQALGVPVRVWDHDASHFVGSLVVPVTFQPGPSNDATDYSPAPAIMPASARASYWIHQDRARVLLRLSALDFQTETIISCALPADCVRWPAHTPTDAPHWMPLPGADDLAAAGKPRNESPAVDQALRDLANHPLYGLVLQLLLLEALDRELGEETVILAPPLNRRIENFEQWAETVVLYRPREDSTESVAAPAKGFHLLGLFDEVFTQIAREVGIVRVASPLEHGSATPWSKALALMGTADLVIGKHDRWTITTQVLDRLHTGALMKDIIRQGRSLREKMHSVFLALWRQKSSSRLKEAVTA